jgi:hypothetical protein
MRAPRGADSKRDATTNPNPDFIQLSNFLVMPSDGEGMCVWMGEVDTTRAEERYSSLAGLAEEFPAIRSSRITLAHTCALPVRHGFVNPCNFLHGC